MRKVMVFVIGATLLFGATNTQAQREYAHWYKCKTRVKGRKGIYSVKCCASSYDGAIGEFMNSYDILAISCEITDNICESKGNYSRNCTP